MRIVHALECIDPASGGPVNSVSSLAVAQAGFGHDVILVTVRSADHDRWRKLLLSQLPARNRFSIVAIDQRHPWIVPGRKARSLVRQHVEDADVVHSHGLWNPFNVMVARTALKTETGLVISPRGMLDPWSLRQGRGRKALALALVWRRIFEACLFVHALTEAERALMEPVAGRSRIKVFPNGLLLDADGNGTRRRADGMVFRRQYQKIRDRPYILFLGRLHYKKGLDCLIDAFKIVSRCDEMIQLVVAGPDQGILHDLARNVRRMGIGDRVHFVGPLYGAIKRSALSGARCFCLPSYQEGFSMAILEALASGTPVVISKHCHFGEVETCGAGTVSELNPAALAGAINQYIFDDAICSLASEAGLRLVREKYDLNRIACAMLDAYATGR